MTKKQRHDMKMQRYRRRLMVRGIGGENHAYRTTGTPCSCSLCDPHKHDRGPKHSIAVREATHVEP